MSAGHGTGIRRQGKLSGGAQAVASSFADEPTLDFPGELKQEAAAAAAGGGGREGGRWESRTSDYDGSRSRERAGVRRNSPLFAPPQQQQQRQQQQQQQQHHHHHHHQELQPQPYHHQQQQYEQQHQEQEREGLDLELEQGGHSSSPLLPTYAGQQQLQQQQFRQERRERDQQQVELGGDGGGSGRLDARIYPEHSTLKRNKPVKWSAEEDRRLREAVAKVFYHRAMKGYSTYCLYDTI